MKAASALLLLVVVQLLGRTARGIELSDVQSVEFVSHIDIAADGTLTTSTIDETLRPRSKLLVLSVIGPGNTGKSRLLNEIYCSLSSQCDDNNRFRVGQESSSTTTNNMKFSRPIPIDGHSDWYIVLLDTPGFGSIADYRRDLPVGLYSIFTSNIVVVNTLTDIGHHFMQYLSILLYERYSSKKLLPHAPPRIIFNMNGKVTAADVKIWHERILAYGSTKEYAGFPRISEGTESSVRLYSPRQYNDGYDKAETAISIVFETTNPFSSLQSSFDVVTSDSIVSIIKNHIRDLVSVRDSQENFTKVYFSAPLFWQYNAHLVESINANEIVNLPSQWQMYLLKRSSIAAIKVVENAKMACELSLDASPNKTMSEISFKKRVLSHLQKRALEELELEIPNHKNLFDFHSPAVVSGVREIESTWLEIVKARCRKLFEAQYYNAVQYLTSVIEDVKLPTIPSTIGGIVSLTWQEKTINVYKSIFFYDIDNFKEDEMFNKYKTELTTKMRSLILKLQEDNDRLINNMIKSSMSSVVKYSKERAKNIVFGVPSSDFIGNILVRLRSDSFEHCTNYFKSRGLQLNEGPMFDEAFTGKVHRAFDTTWNELSTNWIEENLQAQWSRVKNDIENFVRSYNHLFDAIKTPIPNDAMSSRLYEIKSEMALNFKPTIVHLLNEGVLHKKSETYFELLVDAKIGDVRDANEESFEKVLSSIKPWIVSTLTPIIRSYTFRAAARRAAVQHVSDMLHRDKDLFYVLKNFSVEEQKKLVDDLSDYFVVNYLRRELTSLWDEKNFIFAAIALAACFGIYASFKYL